MTCLDHNSATSDVSLVAKRAGFASTGTADSANPPMGILLPLCVSCRGSAGVNSMRGKANGITMTGEGHEKSFSMLDLRPFHASGCLREPPTARPLEPSQTEEGESMRVAVYARVSKADDSQTPENQLIRLRAYAKDRGWEIYREYVDMASGADANRPQLRKMLADARARRFSLVLTTRIDRIARSSLDLKQMIAELEGRGVKFECSDQAFSTNTPTGKLLFGILGEIAEFERALIIERTKAGLARARAQGKRLGRPYASMDIARVLELRKQGLGYRRIANTLGVSHQTVKNRLKNEVSDLPKGEGADRGDIENAR